jgi:predicted peptidase
MKFELTCVIAALSAVLAFAGSLRADETAQPATQPAAPSTQPAASAAPKPGTQTAQSFQTRVGYEYLFYLPQEYDADQAKVWPLVLFLHGSGERGTNVQDVKKHGPPKLVEAGKQFPFILVSPQCPPGKWWDAYTLDALIDDIAAKYHVDPDRTYVTGLSMGGFGTWDLVRHYPNKFAAIVPVCGGGDPQFVKAYAHVPVWAFHGEDDHTVPIKRSEEMIDALKAAGDPEVKFTRYPGVGHDSWVKAYDDPELYEWLLSHKREPAPQGERK